MSLRSRPRPLGPRAACALLAALALASCAVGVTVPQLPGGNGDRDRKVAATPPPSPVTTATAAPAPSTTPVAKQAQATPEPLPSLALLLKGRVTVDTSVMLKAGIAELTPAGVKLISNNGPGLISDKGVGLISDKGVGLVSNNTGNLTSKTKFALAQTSVADALDRRPRPVEGMLVKAFSLRTGELVAGPVATDADGNYRLGFLQKPENNLQIVAYVNNKEEEAAFSYAAFTPPVAEPVVTSNTSDVICDYMIRVLAGRVQNGIDARKRGETLDLDTDKGSKSQRQQAEQLNLLLGALTPEVAAQIDQNGRTARGFAERSVAFADLTKPVYKELTEIVEILRKFDEGLQPAPEVSVPETVIKLLTNVKTIPQIPEALEKFGMSKEQALAIHERLQATSDGLNDELSRVGVEHTQEVLGPVFALPGMEPFKELLDALSPALASPSPKP